MNDVLATIDGWLNIGQPVALATVLATWGSAPRRVGARMGVTSDMHMVGSVSGGCVETAVISAALDTLQDRMPRLLDFGVADSTAWDVGLACGGQISVYVEPLDRDWWQVVARTIHDNRALATAMVLSGGLVGQKLVLTAEGERFVSAGMAAPVYEALVAVAHNALTTGVSRQVQAGELELFVDVVLPRPRLLIVGGSHIAVALKDLAQVLGFRVVLIDPREAFASSERFPNVDAIIHAYPDEAFARLGLNTNDYVVILTHDPKIDDPALQAVLPAPVPYVGVLSSRRTHEKRVERLTQAGVSPDLLARIAIPIGLDIGAQTPEEIALAILAEIVAVRKGKRP